MQSDGNLVFYGPNSYVIYATYTQNNPGAYLGVQNNGKAVVYGDGGAIWTSE